MVTLTVMTLTDDTEYRSAFVELLQWLFDTDCDDTEYRLVAV